MDTYREICRFLCSIAQAHGCKHVAFGCNAHTSTPSKAAFVLDLLPKVVFSIFHFFVLWIDSYLLHDLIYLFKLKIHNVIHDPLCYLYMLFKGIEIKISLFCKRIYYIRIEVDT